VEIARIWPLHHKLIGQEQSLDSFLARWRTLSTAQQVIIGGIAALLIYTVATSFSSGDGLFSPAALLAKAMILLLALPVHELAHAAVAVALGDNTPRAQGRLSLNPLRHLDLMGSILILIAGFGWAKPVMWNPNNIRINRKLGAVLIAFAGPLSNLLMAAMSMIVLSQFGDNFDDFWFNAMIQFAYINTLLAVFNLIPVPPLDGSYLLFALLPGDTWRLRAQLGQYGMLAIFAVAMFFPQIIQAPTALVFDWMAQIFYA
jgi:Zn-dependent protease